MMEILETSILLFKGGIHKSLMKELDSYFDDAQVNDFYWNAVLDKSTLDNVSNHIKDKIEPAMFDYLLEYRHPDRPDLKDIRWKYYLDNEHYEKTGGYKHVLRERYTTNLGWGSAVMLHRANSTYEGNFAKINGNMDRFIYHIGVSPSHEFDAHIYFPLQQVKVKLDRGDILVAPGGLNYPYITSGVINGKFKFIEVL